MRGVDVSGLVEAIRALKPAALQLAAESEDAVWTVRFKLDHIAAYQAGSPDKPEYVFDYVGERPCCYLKCVVCVRNGRAAVTYLSWSDKAEA